jgi:cardiolipin synthase
VGGINIADKYRGVFPGIAWLDYAVLVEGPVVEQIRDYCLKLYFRKFHVPAKFRLPASLPNALSKRGSSARMRINDWFRGKNQISSSYKKQIRAAKTEVFIMASYFLPTRRLLKIILQAAGKGVRVTLVLGKYSDVVLMKPAMLYLYNVLLRNNVEVYEYESSVLHAKVCVVDREWVSVGSHNLNHLSEWMSLEMNVEVQDKAFAEELLLKISNDLSSTARRVEKESGMDLSGRRWHLWWSYKIVSWSMRLLYFLQGRDKRR